ncbi:UNVERIFIED_CONTAM: Elongation factor-like GTPase 1 [Sesamum latifolium]|uniref:Elongation factor-like GTPase 1 n=1 Tax=Sesamum latifolium TaxID=2727402 RepID=A0AAW2XKY8_9LAMI
MAEISEKISEASFDATEKQSFVESDDSSNSDKKSDHNLVRNICILAHVDHGKTTLADHLIASYGGGVLHPKQAGKLRFMDYLDEEQRRAITMKSSSIALQFKRYFINLIDSPGHMDFCSEVSTAARLSDGALILVDAVEGVHIQTHAVLRQAWIEKLTPCLVLNKVDRLICELRLSPMEAYNRLLRIIHEVNGIVSAFQSEKYLSDVDCMLSVAPSGDAGEENYEFIDDEEEDTFQPQKGNVIFACALDGWGFGVCDFAEFYASKLGASSAALQKALWGPHYFNAKTKMIVGKKGISSTAKARPMFVQFILEPLWQVYQSTLESCLSGYQDCCLKETVSRMQIADVLNKAELVRKSVEACDSSPTAPCVVFVSKMFVVPVKMLPRGEILNNSIDENDSGECFLAFARIFSGVLFAGQRVFVLSALYDPLKEESKQKHVQEADLQSLYLMMGQGLKPVASAKAGNIVAIRGLSQHILKSATLSSTIYSWPFSSMVFQVAPTLKVAIEPSDPADMGALMKGLRLLNRADPFVEVTVSARGSMSLLLQGKFIWRDV